MFTGLSAAYNVYGKSFMQLKAVYLSGAPLSGTSFYNPFSAVPRLSALYPGFVAYKLLSSEYSTNFDNIITINVPAPIQPGYIDVIAQNPAGYGTLTQFVIKEPYSGAQPLSTLRPWMYGIKVQFDPSFANLIYTLNTLSALQTFNGNGIITFDSAPAIEIFTINNEFLVSIDGKSIITI